MGPRSTVATSAQAWSVAKIARVEKWRLSSRCEMRRAHAFIPLSSHDAYRDHAWQSSRLAGRSNAQPAIAGCR